MGGLSSGTSGIGSFGTMGSQKPSTGGGFTYGAASSFGGGASLFGAASMAAPGAGAGVGGDIYEIPLDLTKVQNKQKPTKTFEEQTAEEQAKGGILGKTSSSKGILKRPGQPKKTGNLKFGQCIVYEYPKDDQSTAIAKRVDSKDISDMRDEKAKMRDLLQEKENEQLAQIKKMQQMMGGKETTTAKIDESVGSKSKITESYNSDTFEDSNISGSGKK